jgi:hypothetical protein
MRPAAKSHRETPARCLAVVRTDESRHGESIPPDLIREQLSRILESPVFSLSTRLCRFLRFVVETSLLGQAETLKEYVIGTEVYDRMPPYHPSQDSIVRTEARRLRSKLKEYYETEGTADPIFIYFRIGSYAPVFSSRELLNTDDAPGETGNGGSAGRKPEIFIIAVPLEALSHRAFAEGCARAIAENLKHH